MPRNVKLFDKYKRMPVQVKASIWFLLCSFLQKGISVLTTPIFTRLLNTSEYGQYSVFNSWLGIVTVFVSLNLFQGVYSQGLIKFKEDRNIFSSSLQGLTITLTLCWTVIYICFGSFWNNLFSLTTVQMLSMLLMIWATAAFNFWATEQRVEYKYKALVTITLIVSVAKPLIGIIAVVNANDKVTARILGLAIVELIGYSGLCLIQIIRGKQFFSKKFWIYALGYNLPLIPHYLSSTVLNSSDRIMIQSMVDSQSAGIYSLAYSISQIMLIFNTALNQTVTPWIYQKIKDRKTVDIGKVVYLTMLLVATVNIVLIAFAPEAIRIFAPPTYYEAIWVIPPVAMSVYFIFTYDIFSKFSFYYEKTKLIAAASVIGALLNIGLNYICIKLFGYVAAGYTTLVCYILFSVLHYIVLSKICKDDQIAAPFEIKKIIIISVSFMIIGFAIMVTYNFTYIRYIVILIGLLFAFVKRGKIKGILQELLTLRKKG